jgi:hypothetical protein
MATPNKNGSKGQQDKAKTQGASKNQDPMANRPAYMGEQDFDIPVDDYARFPKVKVIQGISPEVEPGHDRFIPDAKAGQILIDTVPPQLIDGATGVDVIPMVVKKRYAEYIPRSKGGGFVASYDDREAMEAGYTPGNDMTAVVEFLCVLCDGGEDTETPTFVLVSCDTPSKLAVAKKWGDMISGYKTMCGVKYRVTAKGTKNKKNQFYYNYAVSSIGWVDMALYTGLNTMTQSVEQLFLPPPKEETEI